MIRDRAIIFLAVGQTLVWASTFYSFPALLLRWETAFGWARSELTGAVTLAVFVSAATALLAGRLIDRSLGAKMMALCTFGAGLCVGFLSMVSELWQFYFLWAVIGAMNGCCLYEPCFALVTKARGAEAKRGIITITLIAGFAGTLSFPLAHTLSDLFGWEAAVLAFAFISSVIAAPLMYLGASEVENNPVPRQKPELTSETTNSFYGSYRFWFLGIGFALGAVLHGVTLHHLLPIMKDRGATADVAVLAASLIGPMQVAGRLFMAAFEKHTSLRLIAISCFTAMALSSITLLFAGSSTGFIAAFVICFGGAYGVVSIIRPLIARQILGEENFGAKSGGLASLYLIGGASAPYLGSLVWGAGGYDLVLTCLVGLALIGLSLYLLAQKNIAT
ncbi:MAG: MFS transporter [Pseudomonadota bacterium]